MLGLDDLFSTIALGTTLTRAVISLRKHIVALRAGSSPAIEYLPGSRLEACTPKAVPSIFEFRKRPFENTAHFNVVFLVPTGINALETGLEDASVVTEALADRLGTIFAVATVGTALATVALVLSIIAIIHGR